MLLGELLSIAWASDRARLVHPPSGWASVRVCDLTEDSRTVVPGSMFVARRGAVHDGTAHVAAAVDAGAVAVLVSIDTVADAASCEALLEACGDAVLIACEHLAAESACLAERFYGRPTSRLAVVGVTGTNGKSTVAHVTQKLLTGADTRCGLIGTIEIDDGAERAPASLTTPPAIELSRTFGVMVESGCVAAAMEVSSHALDQDRVAAVGFDVAVFTNLGDDHVDYHGSVESYLEAKLALFRTLGPGGTAVVNVDDPASPMVIEAVRIHARCPVVRCTLDSALLASGSADAAARIISADASGSEVELRGPWGALTARTPLLGSYNAMNLIQSVASAWAVLVSAGGRSMTHESAVAALRGALEHVTAPPGRFEPMHLPGDRVGVIVDYAHTPDAYRLVISNARSILPEGGRLSVVFGCGGDRERTKRGLMGRAAAELADRVVLTTDNPRTERAKDIIDDIVAGVPESHRHRIEVHMDRETAIRRALQASSDGDLVLLLGKGHETYQLMPAEVSRSGSDEAGAEGTGMDVRGISRVAYDERGVARSVLGELRAQGLRSVARAGLADGSPGSAEVVVRPSSVVGP